MSGKDILSGIKHGQAIRFIHLFLHPVINWREECWGLVDGQHFVCQFTLKVGRKKAADGSAEIIHTYKVLHWLGLD